MSYVVVGLVYAALEMYRGMFHADRHYPADAITIGIPIVLAAAAGDEPAAAGDQDGLTHRSLLGKSPHVYLKERDKSTTV